MLHNHAEYQEVLAAARESLTQGRSKIKKAVSSVLAYNTMSPNLFVGSRQCQANSSGGQMEHL